MRRRERIEGRTLGKTVKSSEQTTFELKHTYDADFLGKDGSKDKHKTCKDLTIRSPKHLANVSKKTTDFFGNHGGGEEDHGMGEAENPGPWHIYS